jgi:uncharacterized membrane protein
MAQSVVENRDSAFKAAHDVSKLTVAVSEPMHDGYGAAVPSSRANAPGMVGQPPSKVSGLLYGLGLGGFVDGIVLHQILQWHHMVSDVSRYPVNTIAGLEVNNLADGFFHLATWVLVLAGSIAAIRAWRQGRLAPNWRFHFGLVLTGWGIFNVVEGLIDIRYLASITCGTTLVGRFLGTSGF